ncbi:PREDICTED: PBAN-type neuropeptides-like [Nicrophorus vespilloides]|uniref:PBAN-type neuropeptides-like n=1 Tax=Nicrophorus vespilloides TaxID=110193 RepID=A0ABM1MP40_NICVS|nr:PREDICTED: PBAN-type neuropeptides-like [Nicrophorus vespilloides]
MHRQVIVLSVLLVSALLISAAFDGQNDYRSMFNKGKPSIYDFVPRLGRESGEDMNAYVINLGDAKWLQDPESSPEIIFQRSAFSPRLGKKSSFSPRLGR